jgi:peptidoglycan/xylan/chitin deacetylase (PgdA/CDA1 family)
VPSHDVGYPFASPRLRLSALRHGQMRAALPRDPFDTFDLLMDESERRGLRATFFFLADSSIYSLDDPRIRKLLKRIHIRGHELGLHGGYETFRDPARLKAEFERLVTVCAEEGIRQHDWGGRQHFLRWENPTTWRAYEEAGLAYDATLGYSARPGFRAGTCREYPVFDLSSRRELRLRERPLVLMDTPTLDRIDDPETAIRRLRDECEAVRGDFTVLWHNNWLVTARQRRLLQAALGETT